MGLRKFIHEQVFKIINESAGDINAARQLINSIRKSGGIEFMEIDVNYNNGIILAMITDKNSSSSYYAELEFDFDVENSGSYTPAVISTPELSSPSEGEPMEWSMSLKTAKVVSVDSDEVVYIGTDAFSDFFKEYYDYLHDSFSEKIEEGAPEYESNLQEGTIKSADGLQTAEIEVEDGSLVVNGIENLKKVIDIIKSHGFSVSFSYGSRLINKNVIRATDEGIETEVGLVKYEKLMDEYAEIWYLIYHNGDSDVIINVNFTDEENAQSNETPENLANKDFEKITTDDEREMFENKKINFKEFINEEINKIHAKTLLESKKAKIEKQLRLLKES